MKRLNVSKIRIVLVGFAASIVLGGGERAKADFIFNTPTNLGPVVNHSDYDESPSISADGLTLFFNSNRPGGYGGFDIWMATRPTKDDPWGEPVNLGPPVNSSMREQAPCISADGLELHFACNRSGNWDIWVTTRTTINSPWGTPVNLGPTVNSSALDYATSISADRLSLFFGSDRTGGHGGADIWVTTRETIHDPWSAPVNLGPTVNSSGNDGYPSISADGRILFFSGYGFGPFRPGGLGESDLWVTTRATTDDPWNTPVNLGPTINSPANEGSPNVSADGSTLFFLSRRPGGLGALDLWQASIVPVVDFNGDEIVDCADMCLIVDNWHTGEPRYDIGPTPLGDGIVDVQDLEVLMSYWQQEILPLELIAYWKLDETEGNIAYDSVFANDAVVFGDVLWQPDSGQVNGALAFDGTDDYISTPFVLNPADVAFSVFAWIKGGAPGQVVISQIGGTNWLLADPSEGKLRTSLSRPAGGRTAPQPLISEFIITDGVWHRVGFVWDGSQRILYVDDVEVARDTQDNLEGSEGGLYIGAGKNLEPGSFFSGLIDDVRIYNRAITP